MPAPDQTPTDRPNFVFVLLDQLRADAVGTFDSSSVVKTPTLDSLAASGVAFENCFVQHTVCTPSRCSIMTGWYPHVRGHRTLNHLLHEDEPNLLRTLRDAGYWIEWHGKNDLLDPEAFASSVDHRGSLKGTGRTFIANPWPENHRLYRSFWFGRREESDTDDHDARAIGNAISFLDRRSADQSFFLYLPLIYPHPPYNIEEPFFGMYERDSVPAPARADYDMLPRFYRKYHEVHGMDQVTVDDARDIVATYYGMVTRTDALLGQLMEALDAHGLTDNTVVIVSSDHGDYTGDYGLVEKWWTGLTDNLVRVPLYIRYPAITPRGPLREPLVESIDILPTVLELAGVPAQHMHYGRSLCPVLSGATDAHRDAVFAEGGHHPEDAHCTEDVLEGNYLPKTSFPQKDFSFLHRAVMVRTHEWKYIRHLTDVPELYDLRSDPREERNLASEPGFSNTMRDLDQRLLEWYFETSDVVPMKRDRRDV